VWEKRASTPSVKGAEQGELDVKGQPDTPAVTTASHSFQNLPTYPDIGLLSQEELKRNEVRRKILLGEWDQCHKFKFLFRCIHGTKRKLSQMYLVNYNWLRYSISKDSVCCANCVLFEKEGGVHQTGTFCFTQGFTDWSNIGRIVQQHSQSGTHFDALAKGENFLSVTNGA